MADESQQHKLDRVRPPRVQITYDVDENGAKKDKHLPFVVGIMADLSGDNEKNLPALRDPNRKFVNIDRDNIDDVMADAAPGLSIIRTTGALPLAAGSTRGIAIDVGDLHGDHTARVESAVRATRARGRVVGPATLPLPAEVRELARDEAVWVGERETPASPLVTLHVRRGS